MNKLKQKLRQNMVGIRIAVLGMFLLGVMMTLSFTDLQADSINPGVYSIDEKPNGLMYGEWTENFWRWMISIPQQNNPIWILLVRSVPCNQTDPNVWYLAPTFGGARLSARVKYRQVKQFYFHYSLGSAITGKSRIEDRIGITFLR